MYRNLAEAVVKALEEIFLEARPADKVIEKILKSNPKWGARDRAFIAENTYEIVRHRRLLSFAVGGENGDWERVSAWKLLGARQFLDKKIPELPAWDEFANIRADEVAQKIDEGKKTRKIHFSIPDWIDAIGEQELGASRWEQELAAMQQAASVVIRVNTLKISAERLANLLQNRDILTQSVPLAPHALRLEKRANLFGLEEFQKGYFELQDAGSQLIAPFLDASAGMRVVDACAGAGGKTLHLAALMHNKGSIVAMDIEQWKLEELRRRSRRAGVGNVEPRLIEGSKTVKRIHGSADRLLLDAPCSGLGVLRRNPDAKWKMKADFLDKVRSTQQDILQNYSKIVRVGGKMVYATCSLLPSENELQIQHFISENPNFKLLAEQTLLPSVFGFDGFYMASLERIK